MPIVIRRKTKIKLFSIFKLKKKKKKYPWIFLDNAVSHWELGCPKQDLRTFLIELENIVPKESVLYLEGGSALPKDLETFLEKNTIRDKPKIPMGTLWPKPIYFHIQINHNNIKELVKLTENLPTFQVAVHIHVYKDDRLLIQWYDAFSDPIFVSLDFPENKIKKFCNQLNINYKKEIV